MTEVPTGAGAGSESAHGMGAGSRLLRLEEVAEHLAISRSMIWKLVRLGEIKSLRIGRAVRIRPADLEAYIAQAAGEAYGDGLL